MKNPAHTPLLPPRRRLCIHLCLSVWLPVNRIAQKLPIKSLRNFRNGGHNPGTNHLYYFEWPRPKVKVKVKVTRGNGVTSITQLRNCVMKILPKIIFFPSIMQQTETPFAYWLISELIWVTWLFEVCTDSVPRPSKCTEIVGGWGFAPDPTGGAYSAPTDP